jgi:transcriptional regulator with XRE-family HTH domain
MLLRGLIGSVLRRTRLSQARTLRDVADVARVSVPYLSEVERGRKEPSSELLAAICEALGLPLTDLLASVQLDLAEAQFAQRRLVPERPYARESINDITSLTSRAYPPASQYQVMAAA